MFPRPGAKRAQLSNQLLEPGFVLAPKLYKASVALVQSQGGTFWSSSPPTWRPGVIPSRERRRAGEKVTSDMPGRRSLLDKASMDAIVPRASQAEEVMVRL